MKREKKNIIIWIVIGCIGTSCLFRMTPDSGTKVVQKISNTVQNFMSELSKKIIWEQYSYLSYYLDDREAIQMRIAEKISQIIPLGSYVEAKIDEKKEIENVEEESYPMMSPGKIEQETFNETEREETVSEEVQDINVSSRLVEPQIDILPEIQRLPSLGGFTQEQMLDFQYLTEHLYVIDPSTSITENELNPKILLSKDLSVSESVSGPQILIYHTHSQETFSDSVPGEEEDTIVGVGNYLTEILSDTYGYQVLHHKGVYDLTDGVLDRDPAYEKALPDLEQILSDNPSIEVVIDLHRDGVDEDVHLMTEINGKPTAKLMFFNGTCRDSMGERTDITNPYREDNLAFSLQMALTAKANYKDLTRVIYLKTNRYNQHLRSRSALVEVGAQTNTVEEAYNAMPVLADLIHQVIHRED